MDHVASRLSMSKRTLYEIFNSKDEMLIEVMQRQHEVHHDRMNRIFTESANAMEGLAGVIAYQQEMFREVNSAFFRDMDSRFKHLRPNYDDNGAKINKSLASVIKLGIEQGVFRKNFDFTLQLTLLRVQMESLKRMEEYFPAEITLAQAYEAITQGFLRSIATPKGIEILEEMAANTKNDKTTDNQ